MSNDRRLPNLPSSSDSFWNDAETQFTRPVNIPICDTHKKENWMKHEGYIDNKDGTVSCQICPWGARINTGRYRVLEGKIVDLWNLSS